MKLKARSLGAASHPVQSERDFYFRHELQIGLTSKFRHPLTHRNNLLQLCSLLNEADKLRTGRIQGIASISVLVASPEPWTQLAVHRQVIEMAATHIYELVSWTGVVFSVVK